MDWTVYSAEGYKRSRVVMYLFCTRNNESVIGGGRSDHY